MQDVSDKYILLEETEKQALRKALIEDRQRFCCFVAMLRPVVVSTADKKERNEPKLLREQQKVILLHYVFAFCFNPADWKDLKKKKCFLLHRLTIYSLSAIFFLRMRRFLCWERSPTCRQSLMTLKPWPLTHTSFPLLANRWGKLSEMKRSVNNELKQLTSILLSQYDLFGFFYLKGYIP